MAPTRIQRGYFFPALITAIKVVVVIAGTLVAVLVRSGDLSAKTAVAPEISVDTIAGTWECIHADAPSILRLEIRRPGSGPSYLALASGEGAAGEAAVFRVSRLSVTRGSVEIAADDVTSSSSLSILLTGRGHAYSGRGRIDASFVVKDRNDKRPGLTRNVLCVDVPGGYIRTLMGLANAAERQSRLAAAR